MQVLLTLALLSRQMLAVLSQPVTQVPHQRLLPVPLHALATEVPKMNLKIRHYLLTGLLVWLPMGVTVWLLTWLVGTYTLTQSLGKWRATWPPGAPVRNAMVQEP